MSLRILMNLPREAFTRLFPEREFNYDAKIEYGRLSGYRARASLRGRNLIFQMSKNWVEINDEIKIGLLQEFVLKLLKEKKKSTNIDLYHNFLRNAHIGIEKTRTHPTLEASFRRINDKFFNGIIEQPNFKVGNSIRVLGSYEYGTDTIRITKHLLEDAELLDYVMHHEMLHKKHKFKDRTCRTLHHSPEFKREEERYPNHDELEQRLKGVGRRKRNMFSWLGV